MTIPQFILLWIIASIIVGLLAGAFVRAGYRRDVDSSDRPGTEG